MGKGELGQLARPVETSALNGVEKDHVSGLFRDRRVIRLAIALQHSLRGLTVGTSISAEEGTQHGLPIESLLMMCHVTGKPVGGSRVLSRGE